MPIRFWWIGVIILIVACNASYQSVTESQIGEPSISNSNQKTSEQIRNDYPIKQVSQLIDSCFAKSTSQTVFKHVNLQSIKPIYLKNNYQALFCNKQLIIDGLMLLQNAEVHGLNSADYKYKTLDSLFALWDIDHSNSFIAAKMDLLLAEALKKYTMHLMLGRLNPKDFHPGWNFPKRIMLNADSVLLSLIELERIAQIDSIFQPKNETYKHLKKECASYLQRNKTEGEVKIAYPGYLMHKGDSGQYVRELKQALVLKGYYTKRVDGVFGADLETAIMAFQRKHNLNTDGIPGKLTYSFINWDNERYLNVLRVNLERCRWLPDAFDNNGITVNISAGCLQLHKDLKAPFYTKVIVGKYKNQTPEYYSNINYLVFNPCWTVPNSIAVEKMLPKIKNDSTYLDKHNMFIGQNGVEVDVASIDFSIYNATNFPFKIYQRTGDENALGKVKFMFDNPYSIYLHDTPNKGLFRRDERAFSHGCIRLEKALELADVLLYKWNNTEKGMDYYLNMGYPVKAYLKNTIPLSIVYLTCFYNANYNTLVYCSDIYSKDLRVLLALEK